MSNVFLLNNIAQITDFCNTADYLVPRLEEGGRLHSHAYSGRRTGSDNGARLQCHALAKLTDGTAHGLHHVPGVAVLAQLAIHSTANIQVLLITDFIRRYNAGTHGRESIQALA